MTDLTRRWFVFGTAAAISVASIPASPFHMQAMPAQQALRLRKVREIAVFFPNIRRDMVAVDLIYDGKLRDHIVLSPNADAVQWRFIPGEEIRRLPYQTFALVLTPAITFATALLICEDMIDDGDPVLVCEQHTYPSRGPAIITPMRAQDAERVERARRQVMSFGLTRPVGT